MDYHKIEIETEEGVYEPSEDSELAAEMISSCLSEAPASGGKLSVLDLGTATGILGILAASNPKVGKVTFADINPKAVALAKKNAERNKEEISAELSFVETDFFSNLSERYDLIIFNAPYLRSEGNKADDRRWSGGREGAELSVAFLKEAVPHLNENGLIILVLSSLSSTDLLNKEVRRLGLRIVKELKEHYFFEDILVWMLCA